ncbi:MAG TPA: adenylate/guanylate cyclase domain-containing protein [Rectinema sp.]|nr:adenylate/guanylate cyclase domain-containing protein [Rectinema sp.]HRR38303.1 adenylate/guanylate cyclase domain-containing protein [Rectinema sp.]HRU03420.1 adenylate/guanylate cyclase domain-containing protein [Rectinema sp.]
MTEAGRHVASHGGFRSTSTLNKARRFFYALLAGVCGIFIFQWTGVSKKAGMALYDQEMRLLVEAEKKKEDKTSSETLRKISGSSNLPSFSSSDNPKDKVPIALVMIDQSSLDWVQKELGLGWPWPRELYGIIASSLCKADVQAYDILFTEPSTYGPEDDSRCAEAMSSAGNVVLATLTDRKPVLAVSNALCGHVVACVDSDGVCRQYQVSIDTEAGKMPSLGLAVISTLDKTNSISKEKEVSSIGSFEPLEPLESFKPTVFLKFEDSSRFERYSAAQVLASSLDVAGTNSAGLDLDMNFEGKIVLIGITAPGLMDRQATPISPVQPGMEVHATFISNALSSSFIELSPIWIKASIAMLALVFAALFPIMRTRIWTIVGIVAAIIIPIGMSFVLFRNLVFYNAIPALAAGLFAFVAAVVLGYQAEGRQRAYLRKAFAQYLSPEVISELIEKPDALRLGGESKVITVLFSDMAGFTAISERLDPERLTLFMNEYLGIISEQILAQGGTLDKYVGDAVVAFWNAPLDIADHALRACLAACRIQEKLIEIGPELENRFGVAPRTRIGIATGSAIVGNLGSNCRFAYTAVGDSVNIASRLETANKVLGTTILTMRETVAAAFAEGSKSSSPSSSILATQDNELTPEIRLPQPEGEILLFRRLGPALVEGKLQTIELWELRTERKDNIAQSFTIAPWQETRYFSK